MMFRFVELDIPSLGLFKSSLYTPNVLSNTSAPLAALRSTPADVEQSREANAGWAHLAPEGRSAGRAYEPEIAGRREREKEIKRVSLSVCRGELTVAWTPRAHVHYLAALAS